MMKTLFLQPPSFEGFDGGAGSRYQARREIRSFWYPTWLAQPAALVAGSKLIDAPPAEIQLNQVLPLAKEYELVVMHTSTPSFANDVKVAQAMKDVNPKLKIGFVGAKVAVEPTESLEAAGTALDFVGRNEFDFTIKEIAEGRAWDAIDGMSYRNAAGSLSHNRERAILENMDQLPFVTEVYNHSLTIEPTQPTLERYWAALNATQRRAGGHPNIGARLGELAAAAGLEIVSHRFVPVIGDARDPVGRTAIMRYFLTLMKSAEPQLRAASSFDEGALPRVWAEWETALAAPDALFAYTMCKLEARVVS